MTFQWFGGQPRSRLWILIDPKAPSRQARRGHCQGPIVWPEFYTRFRDLPLPFGKLGYQTREVDPNTENFLNSLGTAMQRRSRRRPAHWRKMQLQRRQQPNFRVKISAMRRGIDLMPWAGQELQHIGQRSQVPASFGMFRSSELRNRCRRGRPRTPVVGSK